MQSEESRESIEPDRIDILMAIDNRLGTLEFQNHWL